MDWTTFEQELEQLPHVRAVPMSENILTEWEERLCFDFGPTYRSFLTRYGALVVNGHEIYGICGNNDAVPSAVYATLDSRKSAGLPSDLIVIGDDGTGVLLCLDDQDLVHSYDRGTLTGLGQNFEEFLNRIIKFSA